MSVFRHKQLHTNATAVAGGEEYFVEGADAVVMNITISGVATVTFEGAANLEAGVVVWRSILARNYATGDVSTQATVSGNYRAVCTGLQRVRARVSAYTSGTVNVGCMGSHGSPADGVMALVAGNIGVAIHGGYVPPNADNEALLGSTGINAKTYPLAFDGTSYDRLRTGSAANLAAATQEGGLLVSDPGETPHAHAPAANTQATATKAAGGAGVRHFCRSICAVVTAGATAPVATTVTLVLRDGATGVGAILWSQTMGIEATAGRTTTLELTGLNIPGTANTAMTLEFTAAGGANTFESVSMTVSSRA